MSPTLLRSDQNRVVGDVMKTDPSLSFFGYTVGPAGPDRLDGLEEETFQPSPNACSEDHPIYKASYRTDRGRFARTNRWPTMRTSCQSGSAHTTAEPGWPVESIQLAR